MGMVTAERDAHTPKPEREWNVWSYRRQKDYYKPKEYHYNHCNKEAGAIFYDTQAPPTSVHLDDGTRVYVGQPDINIAALQSLQLTKKPLTQKKRSKNQRDDMHNYSRHGNNHLQIKSESEPL